MIKINLRRVFLPIFLTGLLSLSIWGRDALAQNVQPAMTAQEQAAADIAKAWVAAWVAGDANKVVENMDEDILFSPDYPQLLLERGKKRFLEENSPSIKRRGANKNVETKVDSVLALGGPMGTAVLIRRATKATMGGKTFPFSSAIFFFIVDGKIHTLYDIPLERPPMNVLNAIAGEMQTPGAQGETKSN